MSLGVELGVPFSEQADEFADLIAAAESSLAFWDNPLDDEDWSEA